MAIDKWIANSVTQFQSYDHSDLSSVWYYLTSLIKYKWIVRKNINIVCNLFFILEVGLNTTSRIRLVHYEYNLGPTLEEPNKGHSKK